MGRRSALLVTLMTVVAGSAWVRAASPEPAPAVDLAAALKEFQLRESSQPVRDTMRNWAPPHRIVAVVDEPGRTAWLQQAMPKGVTVIGVRSPADAGPELANADALVDFGCNPATFAKAPR